MRQLSSDMLQALFAGETGEAILGLVTIEEDSLSEPIRVTSNGVSTWSATQDSDTAADATGNGNDGTLVNGPTWTSDGPNDAIRGALSFDGVDDYVEIPSDSAYDITGSSSQAVEFWMRGTVADQNDTFPGLVARDQANQTGSWALYGNLNANGELRFNLTDDLDNTLADQSNAVVFDGEWHFITWFLHRSQDLVKIFIDGVKDSEFDISSIGDISGNHPINIGRQGASNTADVEITDVRIWDNTVRDESSIQDNMNKRLTGDESGLVGYWPLNNTTKEFIPCPFRFSFPDQSDEGEIQARLEIDNVDRQITKAVRNATGTPTVTTQLVLASTPDTIEAEFPDFELTNVSYDQLVVEGTLTVESMTSLPFPAHTFDPQKFPNLF